jgi:hypothetical protein
MGLLVAPPVDAPASKLGKSKNCVFFWHAAGVSFSAKVSWIRLVDMS